MYGNICNIIFIGFVFVCFFHSKCVYILCCSACVCMCVSGYFELYLVF